MNTTEYRQSVHKMNTLCFLSNTTHKSVTAVTSSASLSHLYKANALSKYNKVSIRPLVQHDSPWDTVSQRAQCVSSMCNFPS